ncbi:uncharacterized protein LOC132696478 [Cylas formicarius]|uniref:uncharacterized protein LOC132696478 n=1 Tax=Cylas formicarius TaxID=197179 RepID=UPI002958B264|nr:uncharacterized protein LOC132696478 [Cylas formicarius]
MQSPCVSFVKGCRSQESSCCQLPLSLCADLVKVLNSKFESLFLPCRSPRTRQQERFKSSRKSSSDPAYLLHQKFINYKEISDCTRSTTQRTPIEDMITAGRRTLRALPNRE